MEAERWREVTAVFDAVLAVPPAERAAVLERLGGGDAALRAEVQRLLEADAQAADFLAQPATLPAETPIAAAAPAPPPARFGRYEVVERIGRGGFGEVFRGFDPALKRAVAIKTCLLEDPAVRERFEREAEISAPLDHPNITTVFDVGTEGGVPYLVQEFLSGEDLQAVIARRPPLPLRTRLDWLAQAARGLAYAHARGVVHRDVKPSNLRVQADGAVKLVDFGIARHVAATTSLTQAGVVMGTLAYMSPEQLRGEPAGPRADIYALGAVAYELLTYRRPFAADSGPGLLYAVLHGSPPPLATVWPGCPPELGRTIASCLARTPERRPADAGELAIAFERLAREAAPERVPEIAPAGAEQGRGARPAPRRYAMPLAAAALALLVGALAWLGLRSVAKLPPGPIATAVAAGMVTIDALPWGEVLAIRDAAGVSLPLPAQRVTPLAVSLPPGDYTVVLRGPDGAAERECRARLPAAASVACSIEFARRDARAFLEREGR